MRKFLIIISLTLVMIASGVVFSEEGTEIKISFDKADDYEGSISTELIGRLELPEGYHEGLLIEGTKLFVNNGEGINTWVIDLNTGKVVSEIKPVGTFSEGICSAPGGKYYVTDWFAKKLYLVRIEEGVMVPEFDISTGTAHPTGVAWDGTNIYLVTWERGAGTKYFLYKMDTEGNILKTAQIEKIVEPSQLAWDGENLWVTSWFQRRAYKIDPESFEILGYFRTHIEKTTGIAFDGENLWLTGTDAGLRQVQIVD